MGSAAQSLPDRVVLVVDDEELVCCLTARILVEAGFRVVKAHSGEEAAGLLASLNGTVQLVVSDIAMPGMTGTELAKRMARDWPTTPILLVSGQGGPTTGYTGPFLPKPFTRERLVEAVGGLIRPPMR